MIPEWRHARLAEGLTAWLVRGEGGDVQLEPLTLR
jgi:hypothetical protein